MDFDPVLYMKCMLAFFLWGLFLTLFYSRGKLLQLSSSIAISKLTKELIMTEAFMRTLQVGDEQKVIAYERCEELKSQLRLAQGIPNTTCLKSKSDPKATSVIVPIDTSEPAVNDNVISLHERKLQSGG